MMIHPHIWRHYSLSLTYERCIFCGLKRKWVEDWLGFDGRWERVPQAFDARSLTPENAVSK